jgi:hypothetical protein
MTDTAATPTSATNPTSSTKPTSLTTAPANEGLNLTLDNDLRQVLGPVLKHLEQYRKRSPAAAVLEVERDGNRRRIEANQQMLSRLDRMADLRTQYRAESLNRLTARFEVEQIERDLEFGLTDDAEGRAKRKKLEAALAAKQKQVATIDANMASLEQDYRADEASGLATREAIDDARDRHTRATKQLADVDREILTLEADADAEDRDAKLDQARARRKNLGREQAKAGDELVALRRTAVDQTITDAWDPTATNWGIDAMFDPPEFAQVRKLATDSVDRLNKRQAELATKLEKEKAWADGSGNAIARAIRDVNRIIDPSMYKSMVKAKTDAEAAASAAKAEAAQLAATLDARIAVAKAGIEAEYKAKTGVATTLRPAQLRSMIARQNNAENNLISRTAAAAKRADKLSQDARRANPDLLVVNKIDALRKALPKEAYDYDLIDSLATSARLAAMEKSTNAMLAGLTDSLHLLKKPGSKIERAVSLEVGVALEAAALARLRLTGLYGLTIGIEHGDDGTYKAKISNSIGAKLGAKLGFDADQTKGVAMGNIRTEGLIGQERVYKSLGDLLTAERGLIIEAVLKGAGSKTNKHDRSFLKTRQNLIAKQRINEASLNTRLRRIGVTGQVKSAAYKRVEVVTTDVTGQTGAGDATAVFQVVDPLAPNPLGLSVGGGLSIKNGQATKNKYKTFSFLSEIGDSAVLQELNMLKADKGLARVDITRTPTVADNGTVTWHTSRRSMGHDQSVMHYRSIDSLIASLKAAQEAPTGGDEAAKATAKADAEASLLDVATSLRTELETLRAEYDSFVDLSREIPKDKANAARRQQRERLMKARGMSKNEVAAYVRSVSLQYAVLRRMCKSADEPFTGTERSVLRPPKDAHLDSFKDDLQTPRVKMSDKEAKRVFGDDASADLETVTTTEVAVTANVAGTVGGKIDKGVRKSSDNVKGKVKVPSLNLSITYLNEEKFKKGVKGVADRALSIVVDGNFSLTGSGKDTDVGQFADNPADDSVLMSNLVAKLFDVRSLAKLGVESDPALVDEVKEAMVATFVNGYGTMKLDFKSVNGKLRLRRVLSVEEKKRTIGGGVSLPTGGLVNVVVSASASQNKTRVLSVYHGSNTLSELTNLYRTEKTDGSTDRWDQVKKDSKLLRRVLDEVSKTAANRTWTDKGRDPKLGQTLAQLLKGIRDGTQQKGADKIEVFFLGSRSNIAVGASNELVDWLLDLKTSKDKADRKAADEFIDGWLEKSARISAANKKKQPEEYEAAMGELETLFETVIARKTALEDTKADDAFVKKRGFSRAFLNDYVAGKLYAESNLLSDRLKKLEGSDALPPRSVDGLRRRALRIHRERKTKESRELVEDVLALDYASKTLDDLTKFDDEKDKDEAIGMLGADIDKLLRGHRKGRTVSSNGQQASTDNNTDNNTVPRPKVYVNALIEAELNAEADGKFKLVPVIKKGKAPIVKKNMLEKEVELVRKGINADAGLTAADDDDSLVSSDIANTKLISDHDGNPAIPWQNKYYSSQARKEYFEKQKGKKGAVIYTRTAAKRDLRSHSGKSIGAQLRKLMDARARAEQRRRAAEQNRRRKQQAASASSSQ